MRIKTLEVRIGENWSRSDRHFDAVIMWFGGSCILPGWVSMFNLFTVCDWEIQ